MSSFEQTMMDWSPRCYIPSFVEIGLTVPEKKILKGFTIYGHGGHLGHVTSIMLSDFYFLVPQSFQKSLVQIVKVVSEKIRVEICMYTTLGQGQEMTLTFNTYTPSYIQLDVCSY